MFTTKYLAKKTKILLYNESVIQIENLTDGDILMGSDSTGKKILNLHIDKGPLFTIIPQCNWAEPYTVGQNHTLTLILSKTLKNIITNKVSKITIVKYIQNNRLKIIEYPWIKYGGENDSLKHAKNHLKNAVYNKSGDIVKINIETYLKQPPLWKILYHTFQVPINPANDVEKRLEMLNSPFYSNKIHLARSLGYRVSNGKINNIRENIITSPIQISQTKSEEFIVFQTTGNILLHDFTVC